MGKKKSYHQQDVETKHRQLLHNGYCQLWSYQLRHRRFDGQWSDFLEREIYQRPDSAGMLLYDPIQDKVVLIEQFRPPILCYLHCSPWLYEVPAGLMEDGETPLQLAIRETFEETGLKITETVPICNFFPSPGGVVKPKCICV